MHAMNVYAVHTCNLYLCSATRNASSCAARCDCCCHCSMHYACIEIPEPTCPRILSMTGHVIVQGGHIAAVIMASLSKLGPNALVGKRILRLLSTHLPGRVMLRLGAAKWQAQATNSEIATAVGSKAALQWAASRLWAAGRELPHLTRSSLTCSLTHLLTSSLTHLPTHLLTHSFTHPLTHPLILSFTLAVIDCMCMQLRQHQPQGAAV